MAEDRKKERKKRENIIGVVSGIMILLYLIMNWDQLSSGSSMFLFSTIAIFVWLCLVMLYLVYEICNDLKRDMAYNLEDNLVEIRLLKDLNERQLQELHMVAQKIAKGSVQRGTIKKAPVRKKAPKKKRK